jgi:hypothetical protein
LLRLQDSTEMDEERGVVDALFVAARTGRKDKLRDLLHVKRHLVDKPSSQGITALGVACGRGHLAIGA